MNERAESNLCFCFVLIYNKVVTNQLRSCHDSGSYNVFIEIEKKSSLVISFEVFVDKLTQKIGHFLVQSIHVDKNALLLPIQIKK